MSGGGGGGEGGRGGRGGDEDEEDEEEEEECVASFRSVIVSHGDNGCPKSVGRQDDAVVYKEGAPNDIRDLWMKTLQPG